LKSFLFHRNSATCLYSRCRVKHPPHCPSRCAIWLR
jgi:hypothetical protein